MYCYVNMVGLERERCVKVHNIIIFVHINRYYGVSYGSPAIVVLLSFLLDPRSYRSEKHCWVQTSFTLLCFVGPAVLVALVSHTVQ